MGAAVVRRHDLDIERAIAIVEFVLDARVGELHVAALIAWQLVLTRPAQDLERIPIRPTVGIVAVPVRLLQDMHPTHIKAIAVGLWISTLSAAGLIGGVGSSAWAS